MHRSSRILLALALAAASSCSDGIDPRLEPLAEAPIEVGRGLGDLVLGETTLGETIARYGKGRAALLAGDEGAFELSYAGGQLDLLFRIPQERYLEGGPILRAVHDLPAFLEQHPELGELTLDSLSIRVPRLRDEPFFRGTLSRGGHLGGPLDPVLLAYGEPPDGPAPFVAGLSPTSSPERAYYPEHGLLVRYVSPPEEEAEPDEDATEDPTPEPDPAPEEEREPPKIESITLFLPWRS